MSGDGAPVQSSIMPEGHGSVGDLAPLNVLLNCMLGQVLFPEEPVCQKPARDAEPIVSVQHRQERPRTCRVVRSKTARQVRVHLHQPNVAMPKPISRKSSSTADSTDSTDRQNP